MTSAGRAIRIVLADDHPVFRAGLRATLTDEPDMRIVGEATTGDEAVALCRDLSPDVLLLDLRMPGPPAEETVTTVRTNQTTTRIVAVTAFDDALRLRDLVRRGVVGYVLKDEPPTAVAGAVRAVMRGECWFSPAITSRLATGAMELLTNRERELLRLLTLGLSTGQIAAQLYLSEQTTRNYLSQLYSKLDVHSRSAATAWARDHNLL